MNRRWLLWTLLPCAIVLGLAAWSRGAEYDEQYTLFLTSGTPRPNWPVTVFPAGLARDIQAGHSDLGAIAANLRMTDVHPPLYFWLVSLWREAVGPDLFAARLLSVVLGLGALALTGAIARLAGMPAVWAVLITLGCYGFTYTCVVARGFALAQFLLLGGVLGLFRARHRWQFALAGALFGAATLSNYLAVFTAGACLLVVGWETMGPWRLSVMARLDRAIGTNMLSRVMARASGAMTREPRGATTFDRRGAMAAMRPRDALAVLFGFLIFIPGDLWWYLAQRDSRTGQFPPFSVGRSVARLAVRFSGDVLGGLPLYLPGIAAMVLTAALGLLLVWLLASVVWGWHHIGTPPARTLFTAAALAPICGLLALGALFNNTPIEVRYLTFSTPFVGLLLAAALPARGIAVLLTVQAASIGGLILAPQTMQPARAAARAAATLVDDGVVLLPRGNDGVGIVGAFAIESPAALPLLLIPAGTTPEQIRQRIGSWHRVVLALLEQDDASRAASDAMRRALTGPDWREVARRPNIAVYERIATGSSRMFFDEFAMARGPSPDGAGGPRLDGAGSASRADGLASPAPAARPTRSHGGVMALPRACPAIKSGGPSGDWSGDRDAHDGRPMLYVDLEHRGDARMSLAPPPRNFLAQPKGFH
jgi:hypothetical protein